MTDGNHIHRARLVRHARAPMRRRRRILQLLLSRLDVTGRTLAACVAPAGIWTIAMIALSVAVRY